MEEGSPPEAAEEELPREPAAGAAEESPRELTRQVNRFSSEEAAHLEEYFQKNDTPNREQRAALAEHIERHRWRRAVRLGPGEAGPARRPARGSELPPLAEKNIKYWFDHQRRARAKKMRRKQSKRVAFAGAGLPAGGNWASLHSSAVTADGRSLPGVHIAPRGVSPPGSAVPAFPIWGLAPPLWEGLVSRGDGTPEALAQVALGQGDLEEVLRKNPALAGLLLESQVQQQFSPLTIQTFLPGLTLLEEGHTVGLTLYILKGQVRVTYHSKLPRVGAVAVEAATATLGPGSIFKKASNSGGAEGGQTLSVTSESVVTVYIMFH